MELPKDLEIMKTMEALSIEAGQVAASQTQHRYGTTSSHTVDKDPWQQVGLLLVTGFNCAYVLSFSNLILAPLGWAWGITCLAVIGAFAYYANWLLAEFHVINGQRFIRYRDLMGLSTLRKPVVTNMRKALTMQYTVGLAVYYGVTILGYWAYGSAVSEYLPNQLSGPRWANVLINATAFLQSAVSQHSTLRKPVVTNMRKALTMQYTVGLAVYYGVTILGYWAYGSAVSEYLPNQLSGPRWANVLINATAFLQSAVSQHVGIAKLTAFDE
ncbi:putative proline transporter 2 [Cocos nucifera]|uniref:Putative proline transporter 2 n=1 Tax=Cocos nucifera TaxID=13894 RepID=A0A8K0INK6_COCNU|nr:putative proline transporter 2 [Cocos nucifera]